MIDRLIRYLQSRTHIVVVLLCCLGAADFYLLFFSPYRIHDWVETYRYELMWIEIALLFLLACVFSHEASRLRHHIARLSEAEKKEIQDRVEMYNFYDEKGELKLSVKPEMLYYLEAADNYVEIHYMNSGKMEKLLIRNTLKNIEWRFRDKDLIRCHRSFIVNVGKVQVLRRKDGEVFLDFGEDKISPIPVSKGYGEKILERFAKQ